jgi:hypothetical protein
VFVCFPSFFFRGHRAFFPCSLLPENKKSKASSVCVLREADTCQKKKKKQSRKSVGCVNPPFVRRFPSLQPPLLSQFARIKAKIYQFFGFFRYRRLKPLKYLVIF